jgi:hypothetical protein
MSAGHDSMRFFFEPRSIDVIGASKDRGKIGSAVLLNIMSGDNFGKSFRSILPTALSRPFILKSEISNRNLNQSAWVL